MVEPSTAVHDRRVGILSATLVVLLFAGFNLVSRQGFATPLTLPDVAALRFGIGGLLLAPLLLSRGLAGLRLRQAMAMALLGGFGFALFAYAGLMLAPAAHGAVLMHGSLPLFTTLLTVVVLNERLGRRRATAVALIGVGIALMAWDSLSGANARQLAGDACLLLASLSWSAYGLVARRVQVAPAHAASVVTVLSAACFLPIYAMLPGKGITEATWGDLLLQGIFQGVLIGAASIFIYTRAVVSLGASETALFTAAVPCITTLAAIPLLSEIPSPATLAGVGVVTVGMIVSVGRATRPERR